ncbi:unnamed protein product [Chrysoparadoxa australica]
MAAATPPHGFGDDWEDDVGYASLDEFKGLVGFDHCRKKKGKKRPAEEKMPSRRAKVHILPRRRKVGWGANTAAEDASNLLFDGDDEDELAVADEREELSQQSSARSLNGRSTELVRGRVSVQSDQGEAGRDLKEVGKQAAPAVPAPVASGGVAWPEPGGSQSSQASVNCSQSLASGLPPEPVKEKSKSRKRGTSATAEGIKKVAAQSKGHGFADSLGPRPSHWGNGKCSRRVGNKRPRQGQRRGSVHTMQRLGSEKKLRGKGAGAGTGTVAVSKRFTVLPPTQREREVDSLGGKRISIGESFKPPTPSPPAAAAACTAGDDIVEPDTSNEGGAHPDGRPPPPAAAAASAAAYSTPQPKQGKGPHVATSPAAAATGLSWRRRGKNRKGLSGPLGQALQRVRARVEGDAAKMQSGEFLLRHSMKDHGDPRWRCKVAVDLEIQQAGTMSSWPSPAGRGKTREEFVVVLCTVINVSEVRDGSGTGTGDLELLQGKQVDLMMKPQAHLPLRMQDGIHLRVYDPFTMFCPNEGMQQQPHELESAAPNGRPVLLCTHIAEVCAESRQVYALSGHAP